ncbi:MAG: type II/IV secretion system ATPase subunit [Candidatus Thermoplasmatota archaeon]
MSEDIARSKIPSFSSSDYHPETIEERVDRILVEKRTQPLRTPVHKIFMSSILKSENNEQQVPQKLSYFPSGRSGAFFIKQKESSVRRQSMTPTQTQQKQEKNKRKEAKIQRREEKKQKKLLQKQQKQEEKKRKKIEKLQKKKESAVFFVKEKKNKKKKNNDHTSITQYTDEIQRTTDKPTHIKTKKRIGFKRQKDMPSSESDNNLQTSSLPLKHKNGYDNVANQPEAQSHASDTTFGIIGGSSEERKWLDQKIREAKIFKKQEKIDHAVEKYRGPAQNERIQTSPQLNQSGDSVLNKTDDTVNYDTSGPEKKPPQVRQDTSKKDKHQNIELQKEVEQKGQEVEKYKERKKEMTSSTSIIPEGAYDPDEESDTSKVPTQQIDQWLLRGTQVDEEFAEKTPISPSSIEKQQHVKIDELQPDGLVRYTDVAQQLKHSTLLKYGYREGSWDELDFYPISEPFCYVELIREKETLDKRYFIVEVELTQEEIDFMNFIKETLQRTSIEPFEIEAKGEKKYLHEKIDFIINDYQLSINEQSKKKIIYFLEKQFLGLDRLENLMKDPNIEDISCDGAQIPIFLYHRRYGSLKSNVQFDSEEELSAFVIKLAQKCGKHISIAEPMLDATMPDGSRIQMTLSTEVTSKGSTFTIRKFKEDPFSPPDLIEFNTMSSEMVAYLWLAVENGINALIAGGTAAGKTSVLNAIALFIPQDSKIVSIEETREINLPHPNWIPGVARSGFGEVVGNKVVGEIDMYDLMKAALRQRPEYILVGEIRGREAYVLFQAMATGHTTYSTVHADSAQSLIHRLEGKPINIPRIMLQALDIVCIQVISRVKNKRARRCKQIIEIIDIDPTTKEILTNEVFRWDPVEDKFIYSGKSYIIERIRSEKDVSREQMTEEIKNRAKLLEWLNKKNIREFKKVSTLIVQYYENPRAVLEKISKDSL